MGGSRVKSRSFRFALAASSLLVAAALAGCAGKDGEAQKVDTRPSAPPAEFTEGTGAVEGRVVDEELVPILGAEVGIPLIDLVTITDPDGRFSLSNVQPGNYQLFASKIGYESTSRTITVKAGEKASAELALRALAIVEPFEVLQTQRGLFGCGVSARAIVVGGAGLAACAFTEGTPLESYDKFSLTWTLGKPTAGWNASVFEMVWSSNQVLGKGLSMIWEVDTCFNNQAYRFASVGGHSPVRFYAWPEKVRAVVSNATADTSACANNAKASASCNADDCVLLSRVFSSPDTAGSAAAADVGLTYQQQFDQYHTAFFHYPGSADYTAVPT